MNTKSVDVLVVAPTLLLLATMRVTGQSTSSLRISTNCVDVSGSTSTNWGVPVNLINGSVFHRLIYPLNNGGYL